MIKMSMKKQEYRNDSIILRTIEELVPKEHLVRKLEECISLNFIEEEVAHLYSSLGRNSIPPKVLFKLLIINKVFGINSMRKTCQECQVNLAYRWYLGLSIEDEIPNYSTWSKNYVRRYKDSNIFNKIFEEILKQAIINEFVDMESVFYDGTHQKANANKRKCIDQEVEIEAKIYKEELLEEINNIRKEHGQTDLKEIINEELDFDPKTGEEIRRKETKHIKVSTTDPESGDYHKGEHERCFAYTHNTCCDKKGFVLDFETTAGNVHDSTSYPKLRERVMEKYSDKITYEVLDAGYKTPAICKMIIEDGKIPLMPYTRPKGKKELLPKKEFTYDKETDTYTCPNGEILKYATTNKEGYKCYKSNPEKCLRCPLREKCTKSKNHQKQLTVHVWNNYVEDTNELRYTEAWKDNYPLRKETIERIFAYCKENMCLRFTRVKGLEKNRMNATMIFACHNLKKLAILKAKRDKNMKNIYSNMVKIVILLFKNQIKRSLYFYKPLLSTF